MQLAPTHRAQPLLTPGHYDVKPPCLVFKAGDIEFVFHLPSKTNGRNDYWRTDFHGGDEKAGAFLAAREQFETAASEVR